MGSKSKSKTASNDAKWMEWTDPQALALKDKLLRSQTEGNPMSGNDDFLKSLTSGGVNPYYEQQAKGIRDISSINTAGELAKQRSQYRFRPNATAQFAGDEAMNRSNTERDLSLYNALANAYHDQTGFGLQASQQLSANEVARNQQQAALLEILGITRGQGSSSTKSSSMDIGKILGAIGAGVAGAATGGIGAGALAAASASAAK